MPMPISECGKPINPTTLEDLLDQDTKEKLQYCQQSAFVLCNLEYHHCPTPDCSNIVYWKDGPPIVDCFRCQRTSCLKCNASPYHKGKTCEEWKQSEVERRRRSDLFQHRGDLLAPFRWATNSMLRAFVTPPKRSWSSVLFVRAYRSRAGEELRHGFECTDEALAALNIRVCRRCGSGVEHQNGSCLKMKCPRCGYRFCFQCGSENAQCDCTPAHHGFTDNVTGRTDFAGRRGSESYT
jgi:hypothetical protein